MTVRDNDLEEQNNYRPQDNQQGDKEIPAQDSTGRVSYANKHTTGPDAPGDKDQLPQDQKGYMDSGENSYDQSRRPSDRDEGARTPDRPDETPDGSYSQSFTVSYSDYSRNPVAVYDHDENQGKPAVNEEEYNYKDGARMKKTYSENYKGENAEPDGAPYAMEGGYVMNEKGGYIKDNYGNYMRHDNSGYLTDSKGSYLKDAEGNSLKANTSYYESKSESAESDELAHAKAKLDEETKVSMQDQLSNLLESEELSQEFQEKAVTIFETAVNNTLKHYKQHLDEKANEYFTNAVKEHTEKLDEDISKYLDYVVERWMEENKLAIDSGIRSNIAESFMQNLQGLLEGHYIDVPENKADMVEEMHERERQATERANQALSEASELQQQLNETRKQLVVEQFVRDMVDTKADKIRELAEDTEFDSEEGLREKLSIIKESYFPDNGGNRGGKLSESEGSALTEDVTLTGEETSHNEEDPRMQQYLQTLSRFNG